MPRLQLDKYRYVAGITRISFIPQTLPEAIAARLEGVHMLIAAPEGMGESLEFTGVASRPVEANIFATETFSEINSMAEPLVKAMCDGKRINFNVNNFRSTSWIF